jgi:hypothetical protein
MSDLNVLLVSIDSLRRDLLGAYSGLDVRTPNLDDFARGHGVEWMQSLLLDAMEELEAPAQQYARFGTIDGRRRRHSGVSHPVSHIAGPRTRTP